MPIYSHSRLSAFENCPLKYKFAYIDNIKIAREGIEAFMGSRVHDVLEKLYNDLKLQKLMPLKTALAYYNALWKRHWHKDIVIVKKEYSEGDYKKTGEVCIINH
jgi:putative RecB family exonuclease